MTRLDRIAARGRRGDPGRPTRGALAVIALARPLVRLLFRPRAQGWENLPDGAFLLVANHNGAVGAAEILAFVTLYLDRFGPGRPLAGFAHPFGFVVPGIAWFVAGLGAVPSTRADGEATLRSGIPMLMFPGGDYEATRPVWLASTIDFHGRTGFLKMARAANVPIVPLGIRGSHFTAPILWRSTFVLAYLFVLPRALGVKRYPVTLLSIVGALVLGFAIASPWRWLAIALWVASPLTLLPWIPWTIRMHVGQPLANTATLHEVERAVERLVND